ncbi:MAG: RNA ligase [Candidatus Micrarchaeota archaeon]
MFRGEIKTSDVKSAIKDGKAEKMKEELQYIRFSKSYRKIERGTVITPSTIIWGYPHIARVYTLENGIKRNIKNDIFYLEEKIDGYNLRVALVAGKLFAFTRGGYADPFATEKVREMQQLKKFFSDHPSLVLCGEMIGNTPFTPPTDKFDVKLLVFDIDTGMKYVPPVKKYHLLAKYKIDAVPFLGRFDKTQLQLVAKIAAYLHKGKKEGMVIKSADRASVIKYVTPFADIEDIGRGAYTFFDLPDGFFLQRILRSSYFIDDFALGRKEYGEKLGSAFYAGLTKAIDDVRAGKDIEEEFEVLVSNRKIFESILSHMGREVGIKLISSSEEKGKLRIRFSKVFRNTTSALRELHRGKAIID